MEKLSSLASDVTTKSMSQEADVADNDHIVKFKQPNHLEERHEREAEGTNGGDYHADPLHYQEIVERLHELATDDGRNSRTAAVNGNCTTPSSSPQEVRLDQTTDLLVATDESGISYVRYQSEVQMKDIMTLISRDLSEPYSIYTYRYFIHNWPNLCFLAMDGTSTVGAIVCKIDPHKRTFRSRGYIGMLAVDKSYRRRHIGSKLVQIAIEAMIECSADEIVLETEVTNLSALNLYERLGFVKDKRLHRYYLNGVDAIRLKLWVT